MKIKPNLKPKKPEFEPEPDLYVSEILCEKCKHKMNCPPEDDDNYNCLAYKALEKLMP